MTNRNVSKLPGKLLPGLAASVQELVDATLATGVVAHYDGTNSPVTTADADDLATLKTITLDLTNAFVAHGLDSETTQDVAQHSALDAALDVPAGFTSHPLEPADLAECQATLNQLKADFNTHIANATPHRSAGEQGGFTPTIISTTDGSNQATNETLANAIKAAFNIHIKSGMQTLILADG